MSQINFQGITRSISRFALDLSVKVSSVSTAFRKRAGILLVLSALAPIPGIALAQSKIIWTDTKANTIERANLDGSNRETLVNGVTASLGITVDPIARKMYWVDIGQFVIGVNDEVIRRANLDGSGVETLLTTADGLRHPVDIKVDPVARKIYWADAITQKIYRADLDGRNSEILIDIPAFRAPDYGVGVGAERNLEFSTVWGLALDLGNHELYWTDYFAGDIHRASMDGAVATSQITLLVAGLVTPRGIAFNAVDGSLYWVTGNFGSEVMRAFGDGAGVEVLVSKKLGTILKQPFQIELDTVAGQMYWTDRDSGLIQRANLDGSAVTTLLALEFEKKPGDFRPLSPSGLALHLTGDSVPPPPAPNPPPPPPGGNGNGSGTPDLSTSLDKLRAKAQNGVDQIEFEFTVLNAASGPVPGTYTVKAFLSLDAVHDGQDSVLGIWSGQQLSAGQAQKFKSRLNVPGSHVNQYLIIVVDPDNTVTESDETNNTAVGVILP